ncbi:MAG TPA: phosphohydrolase [Cellvibrionales bacterium]|jgi:predicted HD phosphohydrolase|nr:phosphohydrolase [Cellvibrionales bacterium]
MNEKDAPRALFTKMEDGTKEDWSLIIDASLHFFTGATERIVSHLKLLHGGYGGFAVDRLEHSLQTASRAFRDGRDEEYVVCALLHDIGDTLAPANHADMAATLLQPFVSEKNYWMVKHHGIVQGYYFFEHLGLNKNLRDSLREHPYYSATEEFCRVYDQVSFDPNYESMPLEAFTPLLESVFSAPKKSIYTSD